MAPAAHPIATSTPSLPRPRTGGTTESWPGSFPEDWRDAITDYLPPAGPDGCWASGSPDGPGAASDN